MTRATSGFSGYWVGINIRLRGCSQNEVKKFMSIFHCGRAPRLRFLSKTNHMALIRVTSCKTEDDKMQHDMILNTAHIVMAYPDTKKPSRGTWVQLVTGEPILICMSFDEVWMLIQRET